MMLTAVVKPIQHLPFNKEDPYWVEYLYGCFLVREQVLKLFTHSVSQCAKQEKYDWQHNLWMGSQPVPNCMGLDGFLVYSPQACFCTTIGEVVSMEGVPRDSGSAHAVEKDIRRAEHARRHGRRGGEIVYSAAGLA